MIILLPSSPVTTNTWFNEMLLGFEDVFPFLKNKTFKKSIMFILNCSVYSVSGVWQWFIPTGGVWISNGIALKQLVK